MGKGISKLAKINWKKLQKFKRKFTNDVPEMTKADFEKKNIKMFSTSPKFIGPNTLELNNTEVSVKKIVIATGLAPRNLDIEGSKFLRNSGDFLSLKKLPKKNHFSRSWIYRYGVRTNGGKSRK